VCASSPREERRELRVLPDLPKSGRMLGWFSNLVALDLHQYRCAFGLNHLIPCAAMFFFFMIFGGIVGSIFDFMI
jgi:hypothetical protein